MNLVIENLSVVSFSKQLILERANHVFSAGVTALTGRNGVGKSTLLRTLATIHPIMDGVVSIGDAEISKDKKAYLTKLMFMPQTFATYPELTGAEFLQLNLRLRGATRREARLISTTWLDIVGLSHAAKARAGSYSQGMLQRLGIAYTLQVDADVYLLDEPFAGVDQEGREELMRVIFNAGQQKIVILSTHHTDEMVANGANAVAIVERSIMQVPEAVLT